MENLLSNYRSKVNFMNKLQEKKARLDKSKRNRLNDLDKKEEGFKTLNKLLEGCSNLKGNKHKIERVLTQSKESIKNISEDDDEENKEARIRGVINYARSQVCVWKANELGIIKYLLNVNSENKISQLYRKLANEVYMIENTIQEIEKCSNYDEILLLRDKIRGSASAW